ncbi:DUF4253 domain-containing protein [Actinoplanes xinjiangensis]|uniref:DUF4253 domain-containing protein n=1 Tax=Actinoplanes xinjiangensis TaxID=512350 RepID=UPI00342FAC1B
MTTPARPHPGPGVLAAEIADLPPLEPLVVTPSGAQITGFPADSDTGPDWWRRLRDAYPRSGLWPLLMDDDAFECLEDPYTYATVEESLAQAYTLDGAALLAEFGDRSLRDYSPEYAAEIRAELAGDGEWPEQPEQPGLGLRHDRNGRPLTITVALVPAAEPWLVPVTLHYGGWNGYPDPAQHAAIMRHWLDRYGAEPMIWTGTALDYTVTRPPLTRPDALALAWEYRQYNDGEYDLYHAETLTDLAAGLLNAPVWRTWWD